MADLVSMFNYIDQELHFAKEFGDVEQENKCDTIRNQISLEIERRIKLIFPEY